MSYLVLARKYRPQNFEDVVGQGHVTQVLANAITSGRVAHAILFSGPRGTGKTTIARILAKAMNCAKGPAPSPCNQCQSCQEITSGSAADVFEIDGASNNGVDHIRDLRENIKYMPSHSRYKIYIIDEVHMLSTPAFNALLKTLEEPPSHILFFFATTDPQKIPITILSRCQRHDLRRITLASVADHMTGLCQKEGISIPGESLDLIAREAGGSMRDALSLLDHIMACSQGQIAHKQVLDILGVVDRKILFDLSEALWAQDAARVLEILDDVYDRGHNIRDFYAALLDHFRNFLVARMCRNTDRLVDVPGHEIELLTAQTRNLSPVYLSQVLDALLKEETVIRFSTQPRLALEMAFIRLLQVKPALPIETLIQKLDDLSQGIYASPQAEPLGVREPVYERASAPSRSAPEAQGPRVVGKAMIRKESPAPLPVYQPGESLEETWVKLSQVISEKSLAMGSYLSRCVLKKLDSGRVEIQVKGNGFDFKQINKKRGVIQAACDQFLGRKTDVSIEIEEPPEGVRDQELSRTERLRREALNHPLVAAAVDIFDGKVLNVKIVEPS